MLSDSMVEHARLLLQANGNMDGKVTVFADVTYIMVTVDDWASASIGVSSKHRPWRPKDLPHTQFPAAGICLVAQQRRDQLECLLEHHRGSLLDAQPDFPRDQILAFAGCGTLCLGHPRPAGDSVCGRQWPLGRFLADGLGGAYHARQARHMVLSISRMVFPCRSPKPPPSIFLHETPKLCFNRHTCLPS